MCICTSIIVWRIRSYSRNFFRMSRSSGNSNNYFKRVKRNRQLVFMLLLTNLYFIFTSLPYCIAFVLNKGKETDSSYLQMTIHLLSYTNNAFNFVFYGFSCEIYRNEFRNLFIKKKPVFL